MVTDKTRLSRRARINQHINRLTDNAAEMNLMAINVRTSDAPESSQSAANLAAETSALRLASYITRRHERAGLRIAPVASGVCNLCGQVDCTF